MLSPTMIAACFIVVLLLALIGLCVVVYAMYAWIADAIERRRQRERRIVGLKSHIQLPR